MSITPTPPEEPDPPQQAMPPTRQVWELFMGSFGALAPKDSGAVLAEKLTAEHISEEQRQQAAEDARVHTRWIVGACLYTGVVVVVLCFAAFLVHRLADTNPTLLMEILKSVTLFAGGLGAGWGIAKVRQNRQDDEE